MLEMLWLVIPRQLFVELWSSLNITSRLPVMGGVLIPMLLASGAGRAPGDFNADLTSR